MGVGRVLITSCFSFLLFSCGQPPAFLHRVEDQTAQSYEGTHPLKQLQGQRKVDILWVIDNSPSMGTHHANLRKNADIFIKQFVAKAGLEWKMGILSTSINENPFAGFTAATPLNYRMPDITTRFQAAVASLGVGGDGNEASFDPIRKHLTANPTFLRSEATLALIFISDAKEQSTTTGKALMSYLTSLKGEKRKIIAYGVLAPTEFKCPVQGEESWAYAGSPFEDVIGASKGKLYNLCDDFGHNLAELGRDLVTRVERPFIPLKGRPNASTLRVTYQGKVLPGGPPEDGGYWIYDFDLNRVIFHNLEFAPGDTEEVTLSYSN